MMAPLRVIFCGTGWPEIVPAVERALATEGIPAHVVMHERTRPLIDQLAHADVVLPSNSPFGSREMVAAPRLRLIQQPAAGHEGIDLYAVDLHFRVEVVELARSHTAAQPDE